jgi:hypothetical protein
MRSVCVLSLITLFMSIGCGPGRLPQPPAVPKPAVHTPPPPPPPPPSEPKLKKAEVGVGKQGHGYGDEWIFTPVATYWRIREAIAFDLIQDAMNKFKAFEGRAPKDHDEFMEKIIKANAIKLPELFEGESYWYDTKTEQLMIKHRPG